MLTNPPITISSLRTRRHFERNGGTTALPFRKRSVFELAIFGGPTTFDRPLILGEPVVPDVPTILDDIRDVLNSRRLTNDGPRLHAFEEAVRARTGARYCVATDNGTSGLQIAARALGVRGEVIVPSFTFIATAHAFAWQGIQPVFVDVDPCTHTIDVAAAAAAVTAQTTAICGVHLWGNLCDVPSLSALAGRHGLTLMFDAAHALGCTDAAGVAIGRFGRAEILSFHATKFVSAIEGGAVVTDDEGLANELRRLRNFGFGQDGGVEVIGINAKMSEASAVMGLHSLRNFDRIVATNRRNLRRYRELLRDCTGIDIAPFPDVGSGNCQYVVAVVDASVAGVSRDTLLACLRAEGVIAKAYFVPPCHLTEAYRSLYPWQEDSLPVSESLSRMVLCLPNGLGIGDEEVERVCELIRFIHRFGPEVEHRLQRALNATGERRLS